MDSSRLKKNRPPPLNLGIFSINSPKSRLHIVYDAPPPPPPLHSRNSIVCDVPPPPPPSPHSRMPLVCDVPPPPPPPPHSRLPLACDVPPPPPPPPHSRLPLVCDVPPPPHSRQSLVCDMPPPPPSSYSRHRFASSVDVTKPTLLVVNPTLPRSKQRSLPSNLKQKSSPQQLVAHLEKQVALRHKDTVQTKGLKRTSPQSPEKTECITLADKRRRLLSCMVEETFHSIHSPDIQSPGIPSPLPDSPTIPATSATKKIRPSSHSSPPIIRMRTSFTYSQIEILEETFSAQPQISKLHAAQLAAQFDLPTECITSWFSNRRHLERKRDRRRRASQQQRIKSSSRTFFGTV